LTAYVLWQAKLKSSGGNDAQWFPEGAVRSSFKEVLDSGGILYCDEVKKEGALE